MCDTVINLVVPATANTMQSSDEQNFATMTNMSLSYPAITHVLVLK